MASCPVWRVARARGAARHRGARDEAVARATCVAAETAESVLRRARAQLDNAALDARVRGGPPRPRRVGGPGPSRATAGRDVSSFRGDVNDGRAPRAGDRARGAGSTRDARRRARTTRGGRGRRRRRERHPRGARRARARGARGRPTETRTSSMAADAAPRPSRGALRRCAPKSSSARSRRAWKCAQTLRRETATTQAGERGRRASRADAPPRCPRGVPAQPPPPPAFQGQRARAHLHRGRLRRQRDAPRRTRDVDAGRVPGLGTRARSGGLAADARAKAEEEIRTAWCGGSVRANRDVSRVATRVRLTRRELSPRRGTRIRRADANVAAADASRENADSVARSLKGSWWTRGRRWRRRWRSPRRHGVGGGARRGCRRRRTSERARTQTRPSADGAAHGAREAEATREEAVAELETVTAALVEERRRSDAAKAELAETRRAPRKPDSREGKPRVRTRTPSDDSEARTARPESTAKGARGSALRPRWRPRTPRSRRRRCGSASARSPTSPARSSAFDDSIGSEPRSDAVHHRGLK